MSGRADRHACLSESELRAIVDGAATSEPAHHLAGCLACQSRLRELRTESRLAAALMARASLDQPAPVPDVDRAYRRWREARALARSRRHERHERPLTPRLALEGVSFMNRVTGSRRGTAFASALAVALLALVIAIAPVSTLANDVLNRFRVQQFAAITIPMDMNARLEGGGLNVDPRMGPMMLGQLLAAGDFQTTFDQGSIREVGSVDEANAHLAGTLAVPGDLPAAFAGAEPKIYVGDAGSASYTFDVAQARAMMGFIGLDPAALPDPADQPTVTISLDVPASAAFVYSANGAKLVAGQMESPTLNIPAAVDVEMLREGLLAMPGLPPDVVAQIRAIDDWEKTLIIPVPEDATTSQRTVNGAPALLIESEQGSAVLWQKNGILYGVMGQASADEVLRVADSMD